MNKRECGSVILTPVFGKLIGQLVSGAHFPQHSHACSHPPGPQMPPTLHFLGPSSLSGGVTRLSRVHLVMFLTSFDCFSGISLIDGKQLALTTYQMPWANIGGGENISVFLSSEGRLRVGVYSEEALLWPSIPDAGTHLTCTCASSNRCQGAHASIEMHFVINLGNKHPKGPEC